MRCAFVILMFLFATSSLLANQFDFDSVNVSVTPTNSLALYYDLQFRTAYYSNFDFALYTPPSKADKVFANTDLSYLFQLGIISRF